MGYSNGKDFHNDFQELLEYFARDMVNSLSIQDYVFFSPKGDNSFEFVSALNFPHKGGIEPLSQETMEMIEGERPLYHTRYSSVKMLDEPPLFEVYNPLVAETLTLLLAKRIPEVLKEISVEYCAIARKLEAASKWRWREQKKHDDICNKSGKGEI